MREGCKNIRDLVIIELLYSTGIRVGELINLNIKDMNFAEQSCIVLGKGNKQREVYFDIRTKLHLVGFGTFETKQRAARTGRNPRTNEEIKIPATIVPSFKVGKSLKENVNK